MILERPSADIPLIFCLPALIVSVIPCCPFFHLLSNPLFRTSMFHLTIEEGIFNSLGISFSELPYAYVWGFPASREELSFNLNSASFTNADKMSKKLSAKAHASRSKLVKCIVFSSVWSVNSKSSRLCL